MANPEHASRDDLRHPPARWAEFRLRPSAAAPRIGRESIRGVLDWAPQAATERIELLVSELVTNSVLHADLRSGQEVGLRLRCTGRRVRVEVADPGTSFRPNLHTEHSGARRWGIYLVNELADRWGVDDRGTGKAVWFEMDL